MDGRGSSSAGASAPLTRAQRKGAEMVEARREEAAQRRRDRQARRAEAAERQSDVPRRSGDSGSPATPEQGRAFESAMQAYYDWARSGSSSFVPQSIVRAMDEAASALPIGTEVRYEGGIRSSDNARGTYVKTINGRWEQYRDGKRVVPDWAGRGYEGLTDDGFASRISSPLNNAKVTVAVRRGR